MTAKDLVIAAAVFGALALTYHRDSVIAAAPAACKAPDPAAQPADPPDPMDVYHLRQRVC